MARTNRDWKPMSARDVLATRGRVIVRVNRGDFSAQAWPRKRGKVKSKRQQDWVTRFSYVNCLSKTPDPYTLATMNHLANGNGWYPRDLLVAAMGGNLYGVEGEIKVSTPTVSATRLSNQALASGVVTAMLLTAVDWDTAAFWDSVTNPSRLTIKKPGLYWVHAEANFSSASSSYRFLQIRLNGTTMIAHNTQAPGGAFSFYQEVNKLWYFHTGDYVELCMQQGAGALQGQVLQFALVGIVPETA